MSSPEFGSSSSERTELAPEGNATRREFMKAIGVTGVLAATGATAQSATAQICPEPNGPSSPATRAIPGTYAGNIYCIDNTGALYFYQDLARTGQAYWANGGRGSKIGSGWFPKQVFSGGGGVLYATDTAGSLRFYQDLDRTGAFNWAASSGSIIGNGWNPVQVFGGGNGIIYVIDSSGNLRFYQDLARNGTSNWAASNGQTIGTGWTFATKVFSGGNGVIYAIDTSGNLYFYKDLSRNGTSNWHPNSGRIIGTGMQDFTQVFSGGGGVIYAVDHTGKLYFFQDLSQDGTANWWHGGQRQLIGSGWLFSFIMADDSDAALPATINGSPFWLGPKPLEGYSTPISVSPGQTVQFHVRAVKPSYNVTYLRLKKQLGTNTDANIQMQSPFTSPGRAQPINSINAWKTGCNWDCDFSLTVPSTWASGLYAAQCVDSDNNKAVVHFVVKPATPLQKIAVLVSTNTWNAYNAWGGRSQYTSYTDSNNNVLPYNGTVLSFERPFVPNLDPPTAPTMDASQSGRDHELDAALWILGWLEDYGSGYQYDLYCDLDFHANSQQFSAYSAIILSTHPEYWTMEMRQGLQAYLSLPKTKLLYLGGNGLYERVFYADDFGANTSRMKLRRADGSHDYFRDMTPPMPEREILGVGFERFENPNIKDSQGHAIDFGSFNTYAPYKVLLPNHRFFSGTNLQAGSLFGQLGFNGSASGMEVDSYIDPCGSGQVANIQILATGQNIDPITNSPVHGADMTYYDTPSGGFVFSVGSISFGGALVVDSNMQLILKNVLSECI